MLIKLLSDEDKSYFFRIAELLSLSDKPLLWDGKRKDEITAQTDIKKITLHKGQQESTLLQDWGVSERSFWENSSVEESLLEKLKTIPLHVIEEPANRTKAALSVLKILLKKTDPILPSAAKLMLFELMLLALASGSITPIEWQILNEFKYFHKMEEFIFQELLERAECTHSETQKTIALILE